MKTRRFIYIAAVAMSSVMLSCSDDLLDKRPAGLSENEVFSDEALLTSYVNGTYLAFRHSFDDENSFTDALTDNAYNQHGSAENSVKVYTRAEVSQDNGESVTRGLWAHAYSYIRRANFFFEKTENTTLEPSVISRLTGEMQFTRAFLYFELLKWYGGVPLITQSASLDDASYDVARNSADEVAAFIVSECDKAIAALPSIAGPNYQQGRASKEAAMALKARTLLYIASPLFNPGNDQNKWIAARDANKAVMDLTTVTLTSGADEYGAMFRGENAKEVIFARYFTTTVNQGWGVNVWLFPNSEGGWSNTTPTQDLVDNYELTNGEVPASPTSGYDAQDPYSDRDPRFYQSILYNGAPFKGKTYDPYLDVNDPTNKLVAGKDSRYSATSPHNASRTGYVFRKWTQENANWDAGNTGPWIFFRLGEFYLNYAETEIALDNEDAARTAINRVRGRVGMPDVTESGAELTERYRRERRIELVLEDHRFFDMRRWMIGPDALDKPALGVDVYKDGANFEYIYGMEADNTRKWDDRMYLLPIPATEIQSSNNTLSQNDGY